MTNSTQLLDNLLIIQMSLEKVLSHLFWKD